MGWSGPRDSSTRWYLLRLGSLYSIEHDQQWADLVEQQIRDELPSALLRDWTFNRIPSEKATSSGRLGRRQNYSKYVKVQLRRRSFTFVSVDGRARSQCLHRVLDDSLVAPGGLLLLDNYRRPRYAHAVARADALGWPSVEFDSTRAIGLGRGGMRTHKPVPDVATKIWCRPTRALEEMGTRETNLVTVVRRSALNTTTLV